MEWTQFAARSSGTTSPFIVCSAPGRANAKRLRELAGDSAYVQTLSHRKGQPLCSVASLDARTAALVAADGTDDTEEVSGGDRFSLEPMTHLAKLAPAVAADPSPAALVMSGYTLEADGEEGNENEEETGGASKYGVKRRRPAGAGAGEDRKNGGRNLRAGNDDEAEGNAIDGALAGTIAGRHCARLALAARPRAQRLMKDARSGVVDAIEIMLSPARRRPKRETEDLARRWLTFADDQASLARVLRGNHFWGQGPENVQLPLTERSAAAAAAATETKGDYVDIADGVESGSGEDGTRSAGVVNREEEEEAKEEQEWTNAHEERKRLGWESLIEQLHRGRGTRNWSLAPNSSGAGGWGRRSPGACGYSEILFSVSPSGKNILLHRPHELGGGGEGGEGEACLSALLAYVSLQPEVHYVTARRKAATMNIDAAWVTQSGVTGYTPLWNEVSVVELLWSCHTIDMCECLCLRL